MVLADLHIHSTFSDGKMSISEIVDFYGQRGFGMIAITDHLCEENSTLGKAARFLEKTLTRETFSEYIKTIKLEAERAKDRYGMLVIPGFELTKNSLVNHRSAHILALGVEEFISADDDVFEICQKVRNAGGLSVAAHPVDTRKFEPQTYHLWSRRRELSQVIDAWEVASGPHLFTEVVESGLPMLASSDLHAPKNIHAWKTVLHAEKKSEAVKEAFRKQRLSFKFYKEDAAVCSTAAIPQFVM